MTAKTKNKPETIKVQDVPLDKIEIHGGTQTRAGTNEETVEEYAQALKDGAEFPPVDLFYDGVTYWLADGFHRFNAHRQTEEKTIKARVRSGDKRDAILFGVAANITHGLRRSNEDKRRVVKLLLEDSEWVEWSDRNIAERCGVSANFVGVLRRAICHPMTDAPKRTAVRNGVRYEIDTSNINDIPRPGRPASPRFDSSTAQPPPDDGDVIQADDGESAEPAESTTEEEERPDTQEPPSPSVSSELTLRPHESPPAASVPARTSTESQQRAEEPNKPVTNVEAWSRVNTAVRELIDRTGADRLTKVDFANLIVGNTLTIRVQLAAEIDKVISNLNAWKNALEIPQ